MSARITGAGSADFRAARRTRAIDVLPCGRIAYTLLLPMRRLRIDDKVWRLGATATGYHGTTQHDHYVAALRALRCRIDRPLAAHP